MKEIKELFDALDRGFHKRLIHAGNDKDSVFEAVEWHRKAERQLDSILAVCDAESKRELKDFKK